MSFVNNVGHWLPGREGVKDKEVIDRLCERVRTALHLQLERTHSPDEHIPQKLDERIPVLRLLGAKHHEVLQKFKLSHPDLDFPALHKELFSDDPREGATTTAQH